MIQAHKLLPAASLALALIGSLSACSTGYQPALNAQGHPDLQGIWDFRTLTPFERPRELGDRTEFSKEEKQTFKENQIANNDGDRNREEASASFDVEGAYNSFWMDFGTEMNEDDRTSLIVDPPNGRLPALTPEAIAEAKKNDLRIPPVRELFSIGLNPFRPEGPEILGLSERCLIGFNAGPPLTPSAYNNNLRIIQTPNHVVLATEMIHQARIIPMDNRAHLPKDMSEWLGDSRGYWDGNTLVIETTNFTNKTPTFQMPIDLADIENMGGAVGSGKTMHLTERFTMVGDSRLVYEYTLNDPNTFTRPFTVAIPLRPTEDQMYEYACHEGNYGLVGMLRGARQAEKEEAEAARK